MDDYTPINHEPLDIKTIPLVAGSAALDDPENRIAPLFKVPPLCGLGLDFGLMFIPNMAKDSILFTIPNILGSYTIL